MLFPCGVVNYNGYGLLVLLRIFMFYGVFYIIFRTEGVLAAKTFNRMKRSLKLPRDEAFTSLLDHVFPDGIDLVLLLLV